MKARCADIVYTPSRRQWQEVAEFEASLGYIGRLCFTLFPSSKTYESEIYRVTCLHLKFSIIV
jgi:hypothetical protein